MTRCTRPLRPTMTIEAEMSRVLSCNIFKGHRPRTNGVTIFVLQTNKSSRTPDCSIHPILNRSDSQSCGELQIRFRVAGEQRPLRPRRKSLLRGEFLHASLQLGAGTQRLGPGDTISRYARLIEGTRRTSREEVRRRGEIERESRKGGKWTLE